MEFYSRRVWDEVGEWIAMTILAVAFGGFLGAIARYLVSVRVRGMLGTMCVNILGSFLFGLSLRVVNDSGVFASLWLIGFLGAFTTFSTFAVQFVETWKDEEKGKAIGYALSTLIGGFVFIFIGWWIGACI